MAAVKGIGASLVCTSTPVKTIADLTSIGEIGTEISEINITTLDSPNNYSEYIPGMKDAGEVSLAGIMKSTDNMEDMLNFLESGAIKTWRIQLNDGTKWDFSGFVKSWKQSEITVEGVVGFSGAIRITGKPVLTIAGGVSA